jgi:MFS family permease
MATEPHGDAGRWWTLGAVCVATFMLLLDITIVNVALPDIARDLRAAVAFAGALLAALLIRRPEAAPARA